MSTDNAVSLNGTATTWPEVLTLEEAAAFLRLSESTLKQQAEAGVLPGKYLEDQWRFSKQGIVQWLNSPSNKDSHPPAGAGADFVDEDPEEIIAEIYRERKKHLVSGS